MSNLPTSNKVKDSPDEKNDSTADPRKNISDKSTEKKNEIEYYHLDEFGQMKFYRYDLLKISGKS